MPRTTRRLDMTDPEPPSHEPREVAPPFGPINVLELDLSLEDVLLDLDPGWRASASRVTQR